MTETEIKKIVNVTVNQLLKDNMLKYSDSVIYDKMSESLREYYVKGDNELLKLALDVVSTDPYYELLEMYYRDNITLEQIADVKYLDISTVVRNKKRLCIKLFEIMESL